MVRDAILQEIAYESAECIHVYHTCQYCGINPARGERCVECWRKILTVMDERMNDEELDETDAEDGC